MDSPQNQQSSTTTLLQDSLFPSGIIKPRMLAASTTMVAGDTYYVNSLGIFQRRSLFQTYAPIAGATVTLDLSVAEEHRITMPAGNITIAVTNATNGQKFIISPTQDSVGSRTVTWFTTIKWAGGSAPTLTTTASKRDTLDFICTGVNTYDGFIKGQNI